MLENGGGTTRSGRPTACGSRSMASIHRSTIRSSTCTSSARPGRHARDHADRLHAVDVRRLVGRGTRLAYRSTTDNDGHIRVVGADGSNDIGLAGVAQENDYAPSWSPDGTRVVFHGYHYSPMDSNAHTDEIYMASTAAAVVPPAPDLTGDKNYEPMWRPDPAGEAPRSPGTAPAHASPSAGGRPATPQGRLDHQPYPVEPRDPERHRRQGHVPSRLRVQGRRGRHRALARDRASSAQSEEGRRRAREVTVPAGATRALKLRLTHAGIALLRKRRALTIKVAVTTKRHRAGRSRRRGRPSA